MSKRFQLVGIGNAMVDVLGHADDAFLEENGVEKGIMQLIDRARGVELYERIGPAIEMSGGSAANTIAGFAHLGGRAAYIGKVKDDQLGAIFGHDLRAQGVTYEVALAPAAHPEETGRCFVLVTPDGERSMNTYLGVTEHLAPDDIDEEMIEETDWIFLEGYRFDGPESHEAFARAIRAVKRGGGKVALTLSDPFCVERHHGAFAEMLKQDVDLLFANRAEIAAMYGTTDIDAALQAAANEVETVVCTESEHGAHVVKGPMRWHCPAVPTRVVDATGAGDLFSAGFLWGLVDGHDLETCGIMGNIAASEVIGHLGARAEADLKARFREFGLKV